MGKKVFIVHGRDDSMRKNVVKYIKGIGLEPVVLRYQASRCDTIIEKIERCVEECIYAIVLLSSKEDLGRYKDDTDLKPRARQNVIFEFGFVVGKLRRENVAMVLKGDVEKPSDVEGVVYIPYNKSRVEGGWRGVLRNELENARLLLRDDSNSSASAQKGEVFLVKRKPSPTF